MQWWVKSTTWKCSNSWGRTRIPLNFWLAYLLGSNAPSIVPCTLILMLQEIINAINAFDISLIVFHGKRDRVMVIFSHLDKKKNVLHLSRSRLRITHCHCHMPPYHYQQPPSPSIFDAVYSNSETAFLKCIADHGSLTNLWSRHKATAAPIVRWYSSHC